MEIILREDVPKLGTKGQIVQVSDGYARNFLFPRNLAWPATPVNKKRLQQEKQAWVKREATEKEDSLELAKMIEGLTLTIRAKAGEADQLFGSVTAIDIAEALAQKGYQIDKRKIELEEPIKMVGEYDVPVRLHREVHTQLKVIVTPES